jgi:hypothetical protein
MSVLKLPLLDDFQWKVGALIASTTLVLKLLLQKMLFKLVYKNAVMVSLTTGIIILLFTCVYFCV